MPTYEYECEKCRRVFEVRQRISEPALTTCEQCGGEVHRLLSPAPFILKGEGWYVTDYPSESRKKARESEKAPAAESKSDTKSDTKGETKSTEKPADKPAAKSGDGSTTAASAAAASKKTD